MADPVFDEEFIKALLKSTVCVDNVTRLQQGAVFALVDLYDRKVTRDEFTSAASACLALYGQLAKLWVLDNVEKVFDEGELDKSRFTIARASLQDLIRVQCEGVIDIVKRLQECPASGDKVH